MLHNSKVLYATAILFTFISCQKYLEKKPDKALQTPSSIEDMQALLDHGSFMNGANGVSFDESSADNFYLPQDVYNNQDQENRNAYIWQNRNYNNYPNDWAYLYNVINVANVVLDNINKVNPTTQNQIAWNNVKGSALFFRGYSLLQGAFIFCKVFDNITSSTDYGMVLRLTSDFNLISERASVEDTYSQILTDLKEAGRLLPDLPQHPLRPSRAATYALVARTYLSMRKYDSCLQYSVLALSLKSDLLDYNSLSVGSSFPFPRFNKEVYFDNMRVSSIYPITSPSYARVDSNLYASYEENDLRKTAFFRTMSPGYVFKGSYSKSARLYIGITIDEVYLMKAECLARSGSTEDAMATLNTLMINRWKAGLFVPFTASTSEEALDRILIERRKELIFRNLRWMDIKRLNKESYSITIKRFINGEVYTLPPNDNRFALPLPTDIINNDRMPQNPQ